MENNHSQEVTGATKYNIDFCISGYKNELVDALRELARQVEKDADFDENIESCSGTDNLYFSRSSVIGCQITPLA